FGVRAMLWLAPGEVPCAWDGASPWAALFCGYALPRRRGHDCRDGARLEGPHRGLALVGRLGDVGSAACRAYGELNTLCQLQGRAVGQAPALSYHRCGRAVGVVDRRLFRDRVAADRSRLYGLGPHDTRRAPGSSPPCVAYRLSDASARALAAGGHRRSHLAPWQRSEILALGGRLSRG